MVIYHCRNASGTTILDRLDELIRKPWFFGTISGETAEKVLAQRPSSSFLVRMNLGGNRPVDETPFTIVRKNDDPVPTNTSGLLGPLSTTNSHVVASNSTPIDHLRVYFKSSATATNESMMDTSSSSTTAPFMSTGFIVKYTPYRRNARNQKDARLQTQSHNTTKIEDFIFQLQINDPDTFKEDQTLGLPRSKYHLMLDNAQVGPKYVDQ